MINFETHTLILTKNCPSVARIPTPTQTPTGAHTIFGDITMATATAFRMTLGGSSCHCRWIVSAASGGVQNRAELS